MAVPRAAATTRMETEGCHLPRACCNERVGKKMLIIVVNLVSAIWVLPEHLVIPHNSEMIIKESHSITQARENFMHALEKKIMIAKRSIFFSRHCASLKWCMYTFQANVYFVFK